MIAAMGANKMLQAAWRRARGEEPPTSPERGDVPWKQALLWVVLSSAVIAAVRLIAARSAAAGVERARHRRSGYY